MPSLLRTAWVPPPERVRKLPAGLFSRLLTKASRWSQFTSDVPPSLARTHAVLTFGTQRFELRVDYRQRAFCFTASESCHSPLGVVMSLKGMLDEILEQVHPLLRCAVGVSAAGASSGAGLVDLAQLQAATQSLSCDATSVVLDDGVTRSLAPLKPWVALDDPGPAAGFDIFLSFTDADAPFAGKLADTIGRQAMQAGRGRVRVFPSFKEGREERLRGIARSRVFVPIVSSACLARWHHDKPPMTAIQLFVLACAVGTAVHIAVDVAYTVSVAPGSATASLWRFVVMVVSLAVPCAAQAWAVSRAMRAEAASSADLAAWQRRHSGAFPVLFVLGCVRPDLMASLLRCRAFGWDLFDAPLQAGTSSYLASFSLVSTALHDIPQLAAQWDAGTLLARVAMGCGLVSLLYTLASRYIALIFLSASARVRQVRPTQPWGRDEVDPLLLEWIVALDVCHSRARGGVMSYNRYRKEGLRKLAAATRHDLVLVMPVILDAIGAKGEGGGDRVFTNLDFAIHRQVPTATAEEGTRLLQEKFGVVTDHTSAVQHTLHQTVHRMVNLPDVVDVTDELAGSLGQRGANMRTWEVYERLAGFLVHRIGRLQSTE
jgi:hypothetical protein